MFKRASLLALCGCILLAVGGCGKKDQQKAVGDEKTQAESIFTAFNSRNYNDAKFMIAQFLEQHPEHELVSSFRLMVADISYEQGEFATSFEAYNFFREFYPADQRAEYAAYKAAHAKFHQAHHVTCDSGPVEDTITLCKSYKDRQDYQQFRSQIEDLERTCHRHLLDKDLYVVNSYITQKNLNSARHRLNYIKENFDLSDGGHDKIMFYEAKLAKSEDRVEDLNRLVDDLHTAYPDSQFTAMADRLSNSSGFLS